MTANLPLSSVSHRHQLFQWLMRTGRTGKWVEVGVADGGHSRMMLEMADFEHLFLVDSWDDKTADYLDGLTAKWFESCCKLHDDHPERTTLIRQYSVDAADLFSDGELDFIFIDADHSYDGISADLAAWYPKLRSGGVLAGHDYIECPTYGVIRAVDEFVKVNRFNMVLIPVEPHDNPVWAFVKP